ncbi:glycosyltransferase [Candidatus Pelagibacter sp.]|jgi:glycosyltransferase involved in cell wall biosynthesis|nr:glycosyltransferase [Candidatus Pelagibacter sp.]
MKVTKSISTVIPTFNRKLFLKKAIESCLDQTINHEIIVCNHGGTDGTDEMVKQFNDKIKYIKKEVDNGPIYCWLDGVMEAKGEFINLLFDDDWIETNYIEECMKYFDDPKVGFVFSQAKSYDDKHQKFETLYSYDYLVKDGVHKVSKYELPLLTSLISPTSFIIRKKDMIDSLHNGKLPFAKYSYKGVGPDRFMYLLCMLRYSRFGFVNKPLAYYRKHIGSITTNSHSEKNKTILIKKAYDEVDKYYYTVKYGKIFSFLNNFYIFGIRFILKNPVISFKKLISKLSREFNKNKKK